MVDEKGAPIHGATVKIKDAQSGSSTNTQGIFRLSVPPTKKGNITVVASFVGYRTAEAKYTEGKQLKIILREANVEVDEVKVISTGVFNKTKENFTGAATVITKKDLRDNFSNSLLKTVSILEPSLRIVEENALGSDPNIIPKLELRGAGTFYNFQDMKGFSRTNVNAPLVILDGFEITLERFVDLNEEEIETITILKDAGATSLYGSRGANGVIVVTSSRPQEGEVRVKYSGKVRIEIPDLSSYNFMDAKQKLEAEALAGIYDPYPEYYDYLIDRVYNKGVNTDWLKVPTRTGVGQNHKITASGGNEALRYNLNFGYDERVGVMKGSYRNVFNASMGIAYVKDNIYIGQTFSANITNSQESPYGDFKSVADLNPYWTMTDDEGEYIKIYKHPQYPDKEFPNPAYNATLSTFDKRRINNYMSNTQVQYTFLTDFRAEGRLSISLNTSNQDEFKPASHTQFMYTADPKDRGGYYKNNEERESYEGSFNLIYGKEIGKHSVNAAVNTSIRATNTDQYRVSASGFLNDNINHFSNAIRYTGGLGATPNGEATIQREVQFMANANYYYDTRYFADLMIRKDGGSSFGNNSRWANFYSAGVGWTVSREKFFKLDFVDLFRLKYSYGVSGSLNYATPYMSMYVLEYDINMLYADKQGAYLLQYGNKDLSWQRTYQQNFATDITLFNGNLEISGSYYDKLTKNSVQQLSLTPSHGYEQFTGNIGDIRNTGWELRVSPYIIRNDNLKMRLTANFSANKNVIEKMSDQMKQNIKDQLGVTGSGGLGTYDILVEGGSMSAMYVFKSVGIDPISGRRMYADRNGMIHLGTESLHSINDRYYAGDTEPKANGSSLLYIQYKGISVNVGFSYKWGGYAYNYTAQSMIEDTQWVTNVDRRVYSSRWKKIGDKALLKNIANNEYTYKNTQFVEKNNVISLSYVNISYEVPRNWLKKINVSSMRFMVQLSELWTSSTIWQQRGTQYPYSINPNFTFEFTF